MYSDPVAYLLTWSTYGTRLHGDERGTVDDEHNRFGTPALPPNAARRARETDRLRHEPVTLTDPMRRVVRDTLIEHCPYRRCRLVALNVRTTHVHLVVAGGHRPPGRLVGSFKARATRGLRDAGMASADTEVWTSRSSTRYLWDDLALAAKVRYVIEEQGPIDEFAVRGTHQSPRR